MSALGVAGWVPSAREAGPKVPKVGVAASVADMGGLAAEISQLRCRLGGTGQGPEVLLFNLVSTSGLALPLHNTLMELLKEVVEGRVAAEKKEIARISEEISLLGESVSSNLALKLVVAERDRHCAQELADHRGMRLMRFQEGRKVVDVEMKRLL